VKKIHKILYIKSRPAKAHDDADHLGEVLPNVFILHVLLEILLLSKLHS
jgi:hypothetical protein